MRPLEGIPNSKFALETTSLYVVSEQTVGDCEHGPYASKMEAHLPCKQIS